MSIELSGAPRRETAEGHEWIVLPLNEEPAEAWKRLFRSNLPQRLSGWTWSEKAMMNSLSVGNDIRFILNQGIAEDLERNLNAIADAVSATTDDIAREEQNRRYEEGRRAAMSGQQLSALDDALRDWPRRDP
jgi:hypothetical protein